MKKTSKFLLILILLTLGFIWGNSILPAEVSDSISNPVLNFVRRVVGLGLPETGSALWISPHLIRKLAHASEFLVLGLEAALLARNQFRRFASHLLLFGLGVGMLDETIQLFSSGRSCQVSDVWIDFSGYLLGILLMWLICKAFRRTRV